MVVYINGRLVPLKEAVISVFDHGFLYGDGIYETLRSYDGVIFMVDEHLKRLYRSASFIELMIPFEMNILKNALYNTLHANNLYDAYVRLTISRGVGQIGLDPKLCPEPTIVIIAQPIKGYPNKLYKDGVYIITSETRRNPKESINPAIKSLNFLNNILAKIEATKKDAFEAIMLNLDGHLTEGTITNIFFVKDGKLCTPSVECGILDGITRGIVIDIACREDLEVIEGRFTRDDIYFATEVFITNTSLEVMPVSKVDDITYPVGRITKCLHKVYKKEVLTYVEKIKAEGLSPSS